MLCKISPSKLFVSWKTCRQTIQFFSFLKEKNGGLRETFFFNHQLSFKRGIVEKT
ncbi:MAG: hypothetical protein RL757_986 [Bacteroidota bacterium]|jgi:hypothetical protein